METGHGVTGFGVHDHRMTNTLAPTDPRYVFALAVRTGTEVMGHVRPDVLDRPTPCDEFAVRDVAAHLVGVLEAVAALGRGEDPFAVPPATAPDDGWLDRWTAAAHAVQAAWTDDVLDRPMALPWQQGPGGEILRGYVSEVTVHTWDLAKGLGVDPAWDDRALEVAIASVDGFLPATGRLSLFEQISKEMGFDTVQVPFADAVPVADDAPVIDRLVAWNGRDPRWTA